MVRYHELETFSYQDFFLLIINIYLYVFYFTPLIYHLFGIYFSYFFRCSPLLLSVSFLRKKIFAFVTA